MKLILLVLFFACYVFAEDQAGVGLILDDIPKSVRGMGMGEVEAALNRSPTSSNFEPAFFPNKERFTFTSFHATLPFDDQLFSLGTGVDFGDRSGIRLLWRQIISKNIEKTEIDSITSADTLAYHVIGTMDSYENILSMMFGFILLPGLNGGIAIKYYHNRLDNIKSEGFGADGALAWQAASVRYGASMIIRNLWRPILRDNIGKERLPQSVHIGGFASPLSPATSFHLEASQRLTGGIKPVFSSGLEYTPFPVFAFRLGYGDFGPDEIGALCFGIGINLKGVFFDYAFSGRQELGFTGAHRFGIGYKLNDTN